MYFLTPAQRGETAKKYKKFKDPFFALGNHRNYDDFFIWKKPEYDAP